MASEKFGNRTFWTFGTFGTFAKKENKKQLINKIITNKHIFFEKKRKKKLTNKKQIPTHKHTHAYAHARSRTHTPTPHTNTPTPTPPTSPRPHARTATDPHTNRILFFANVLKLNLLRYLSCVFFEFKFLVIIVRYLFLFFGFLSFLTF